jgi:hypothetical protein
MRPERIEDCSRDISVSTRSGLSHQDIGAVLPGPDEIGSLIRQQIQEIALLLCHFGNSCPVQAADQPFNLERPGIDNTQHPVQVVKDLTLLKLRAHVDLINLHGRRVPLIPEVGIVRLLDHGACQVDLALAKGDKQQAIVRGQQRLSST